MSGPSGGRPSPSTPRSRGLQDQPSQQPGANMSPEASTDPCHIIETTTLNSPDRTVLAMLREGDELDIELREEPTRRLLATRDNNVAGSITSAKHAHIVQCIRTGREYKALVRSIRGGFCQVRVQPK